MAKVIRLEVRKLSLAEDPGEDLSKVSLVQHAPLFIDKQPLRLFFPPGNGLRVQPRQVVAQRASQPAAQVNKPRLFCLRRFNLSIQIQRSLNPNGPPRHVQIGGAQRHELAGP
ncbi:MAG TPA: hypothetical protein PK614_03515 [Nitrospira sp.]|nr:hypothetical protein [Nitrospira sp.]